jgi:diketogulonate reductase-like aldo/keto reductase
MKGKSMAEMNYVELYSGQALPVLGLGTWDIGGGTYADRSRDAQAKKALQSAIEIGYTHFDAAEIYGAGHTEELIGEVLAGYDRESFFITTKVNPGNLRYQDVLRALEGSLKRLRMDYVDLYLIHWPSRQIPLEETFQALNQLVERGSVRHVGVSNFSLDLLKQSQALSGTPVVTNQVPYSVRDREYVRNGVLGYCQANGILLTAYSPLKRGVLSDPAVRRVASRRGASPAQVALSWLLGQPGVITIPKSSNRKRQEENYAALALELTAEEMSALDQSA